MTTDILAVWVNDVLGLTGPDQYSAGMNVTTNDSHVKKSKIFKALCETGCTIADLPLLSARNPSTLMVMSERMWFR